MRRAPLVCVVFLVACAACSSPSPQQPGCVPGASLPCACTDGRTGAQTCLPGRTLGACSCTLGGAGGSGAVDAAATGQGGASASGGAGGAVAGTGGAAAGTGGAAAGTGGATAGAGGQTASDGGPADAPAGVDSRDAGGKGGTGGAVVVDAGADVPQAAGHLVFPGAVRLVGSGSNSCSSPTLLTSDRWCAFDVELATGDELWVVNASRAAAGASIRCDGTDASCIRLTTTLFIDSQFDVAVHGFDGETLIYEAETGPTFDPTNGAFVGPVYAWRPGWTAGRKLTSDSGVLCVGQARAQVALCFDNLVERSSAGAACTSAADCLAFYDLHVGALPAAGGPALPRVESVLAATAADPTNVVKFQFALSPDGGYAAWSARPTAAGLETLKVLRLGDAAPATVASDVSQWQISPDSARWYWLRTFNYNVSGAPSGTLQGATFPGGASPVTLANAVGDFNAAGTKGIMFRDAVTAGRGNLKLMADRDVFAAVTTLDTGVLGVVAQSSDGSRVVYAKNFDSTNQVSDLFLAAAGASSTVLRCSLTTSVTAAPIASFLASGGGVAWANFNGVVNAFQGVFTGIPSCSSAVFATNVLVWTPIADLGFVYGDDSTDGLTMTLRHAHLTGATLPAGAPIQLLTDPVFGTLFPGTGSVVYTVDPAGAAPGLYVSAQLPYPIPGTVVR